MLTTNMIRKDLNSHNMYDSGTALTGLACFINGDLAKDLANDVMTLVSLVMDIQIRQGICFTDVSWSNNSNCVVGCTFLYSEFNFSCQWTAVKDNLLWICFPKFAIFNFPFFRICT